MTNLGELLKDKLSAEISVGDRVYEDFVGDFMAQNGENIHYMYNDREHLLHDLEYYFRSQYAGLFREERIDELLDNKKGE